MREFPDHLRDVFERFGPIELRRLFGGFGVYREGLMFGLVIDDTLYLKADAATIPSFEALGLVPFEYLRAGKQARLNFYQAPLEVLEDRDQAAVWARQAFETALRARQAKATRPAKPRRAPSRAAKRS